MPGRRRVREPLKLYKVTLVNGSSHMTTGRSIAEIRRRYGSRIIHKIKVVRKLYPH